MEENKNKPEIKTKATRFLIYTVIGFAVAFIYRQLKN